MADTEAEHTSEDGDGAEVPEQQPEERDEFGDAGTLLEGMLADRFEKGVEMDFGELTLVRLNTVRGIWRVYHGNTQVDTISVVAFRSVAELREWLGNYTDGEDDGE